MWRILYSACKMTKLSVYTLCGTVALLMQVTRIAMTSRQSCRLSNPSARYFNYRVKELRIHQWPFRGQAQRMLLRHCHGNGNDFIGMVVIGHSKNHWRTALTWNCMSAGWVVTVGLYKVAGAAKRNMGEDSARRSSRQHVLRKRARTGTTYSKDGKRLHTVRQHHSNVNVQKASTKAAVSERYLFCITMNS